MKPIDAHNKMLCPSNLSDLFLKLKHIYSFIYGIFSVLIFGFIFSDHIYGQSTQKIGITEWNTSVETKLKVVTHATSQCVNPADLKAGLRLSAEKGIVIDFIFKKHSVFNF